VGETLCLFEDATATILTTIVWSGSLKGPSMGSFSMADPLLLRQAVVGIEVGGFRAMPMTVSI
jgi:hypothetical protein